MFERVTYTVRWGYLVENQREDWQAMEAALSEKLSELAETFVPVRVVLFTDQRPYDVTHMGGASVTDEQIEAAWDHVWETAVSSDDVKCQFCGRPLPGWAATAEPGQFPVCGDCDTGNPANQ